MADDVNTLRRVASATQGVALEVSNHLGTFVSWARDDIDKEEDERDPVVMREECLLRAEEHVASLAKAVAEVRRRNDALAKTSG